MYDIIRSEIDTLLNEDIYIVLKNLSKCSHQFRISVISLKLHTDDYI